METGMVWFMSTVLMSLCWIGAPYQFEIFERQMIVCDPACEVGEVCGTGGVCVDGMHYDDSVTEGKPRKCGTQLECKDGACATVCDGVRDCSDGADEDNCLTGCQCAVDPATRRKCDLGSLAVNEANCKNQSCCWEERRKTYWCYLPDQVDIRAVPDCVNVPKTGARTRCAHEWRGISKSECQCQGCCCDPSRGAIWCYSPAVCAEYTVIGSTSPVNAHIVNDVYTMDGVATCPDGDPRPVFVGAHGWYLQYEYSSFNAWYVSPDFCKPSSGARLYTSKTDPAAADQGQWRQWMGKFWESKENTKMNIVCTKYASPEAAQKQQIVF